ncbi:hypothetical protein DFH06DRAFT_1290834 [Mycena polygramma]|nr:hypothetical protein DFH06DRAFT_1290834 [Mycena polygramma]
MFSASTFISVALIATSCAPVHGAPVPVTRDLSPLAARGLAGVLLGVMGSSLESAIDDIYNGGDTPRRELASVAEDAVRQDSTGIRSSPGNSIRGDVSGVLNTLFSRAVENLSGDEVNTLLGYVNDADKRDVEARFSGAAASLSGGAIAGAALSGLESLVLFAFSDSLVLQFRSGTSTSPQKRKRRQFSSRAGKELSAAFAALSRLKESSEDAEGGDDFDEGRGRWWTSEVLLRSRPHANETQEPAQSFDIQCLNPAELALDTSAAEKFVATTKLFGKDGYMSSERYNQHLRMLDDLVPPGGSDACARRYIDCVLFRVAAMVQEDPTRHLIINADNYDYVPAAAGSKRSKPQSRIGYTTVITDSLTKKLIFDYPTLRSVAQQVKARTGSGFIVVEAKKFPEGNGYLAEHLPQACAEIYALAKTFQQNILRGALSNGQEWIFIILKCNDNGEGAVYQDSRTFKMFPPADGLGGADLIAAILLSWMERSEKELEAGDLFGLRELSRVGRGAAA